MHRMHRTRGFFVGCSLCVTLLAAGAVRAVPVTSLYVVLVPSADPTQAAQEAMRVELVRLTGARAAASDPALQGLIDRAAQYVQLERTTTSGQVQVLFDEPALSAAIMAAGHSLWGADRPLLWIELPPEDAATDAALRARLATAAQERGLPITVVTAASPAVGATGATGAGAAAAPTAPASPAVTPAAQNPLDAARSAGASAALVAQPIPNTPGSLQWTLLSADTGGQWVGGPELAIDAATDLLASATRTLDQAPVAQYDCQISGVSDLAGFVNVLSAVHSAPGITQATISDVNGDALTLHVSARGSGPEVERSLASERLQPTGPGTNGLLEYRYVPAP